MDIGVGVYDVLEGDMKFKGSLPESTMPIVRVDKHRKDKMEEDKDESSSSSASDNLFYEFGTDSDGEMDNSDGVESATTIST
jgi:hypothetical protein